MSRYDTGAAVAGALVLAALSTFGDFVWARFGLRHRATLGLAHGTLLLLAMGLYLGLLRRRPLLGALAGALVGLLAAVGSGLAFYAISGIWTNHTPGGPSYPYNFLCWTIAFLPGFAALVIIMGRPKGGP